MNGIHQLLVVGGDETGRQNIANNFRDDEYELVFVPSGEESLEQIKKQKPDIILLDILSEGIDAYETCAKLRENYELSETPIIFLSPLNTVDERIKAYEAGGTNFIAKPANNTELRTKVNLALHTIQRIESATLEISRSQEMMQQVMNYSTLLGHVLLFLQQSYNSHSMEEIADNIFNTLKNFNLKCTLQFHKEGDDIDISDTGKHVPPLESNVISLSKEHGRYFDFGARTVINYKTVSLLVKNMPIDKPDEYGPLKDSLYNLIEGADARLQILFREEKLKHRREELHSVVNEVLVEISKQFSRVSQDNALIIENMVADIDDAVSAMTLTEFQEEQMSAITKKAVQEVNDVFYKGLSLDKHLVSVSRAITEAFKED